LQRIGYSCHLLQLNGLPSDVLTAIYTYHRACGKNAKDLPPPRRSMVVTSLLATASLRVYHYLPSIKSISAWPNIWQEIGRVTNKHKDISSAWSNFPLSIKYRDLNGNEQLTIEQQRDLSDFANGSLGYLDLIRREWERECQKFKATFGYLPARSELSNIKETVNKRLRRRNLPIPKINTKQIFAAD